ncbi:MAG: hypothetical protein ABIH41_05665 [Nanoarchaeota archaeon]
MEENCLGVLSQEQQLTLAKAERRVNHAGTANLAIATGVFLLILTIMVIALIPGFLSLSKAHVGDGR